MGLWRQLDSLTQEIHIFGTKPKKLKAKKQKKPFPWFLLLLLLIPFSFLQVDIQKEQSYTVRVPYQQQAASQGPQPTLETLCDTREFNYDYSWGEWQQLDSYISPTYYLSNNEPESGIYTVQFAYFDADLYPYDNFEGKAYETIASRLPWQAAAMIAEKKTYNLRARQTIEITQFVIPQSEQTNYWVYANVQAPSVTNCQQVRTFKDNNQTVTKYREEQRVKIVNKSVEIWRWPIEKLS